jgi:deoxyribodipyrimidine photolyase-related protein
MSKLVIILGDQLTTKLSALEEFKKDEDEILMMEVLDESSYVKHHKKS